MIEATKETFVEEINSEKVLVDFWAPWCGPCKMLSGTLEQIQKETNIKIVKVNVDEESELASTYNIRSLPTLILFKNGEMVNQIVGAVSKNKILEML
ncbi:MAG TPA: thioredoxin [Caldisericia bacterium]|nr:thioredoxin [Methanofastidiosum sp.]HQJ56586.1 thioredoxin [Caldisericia bacterium]